MAIIADFDYYKNEYHGLAISDESEYLYFAEGASDELAPFVGRVPKTEDGQKALKRCSCRVADILYNDFKSSKYGKQITSESVSGYYSVSYGTASDPHKELRHAINAAVNLYIGRYVCGAVKVTY